MIATIPLEKGYVKGYYEKRNGRLVWIRPYVNSKDKSNTTLASKVSEYKRPSLRAKKVSHDVQDKKQKYEVGKQHVNNLKVNDIVQIVLRLSAYIRTLGDSEVSRLYPVLYLCRVILQKEDAYDSKMDWMFEPVKVAPTQLTRTHAYKMLVFSKYVKSVMYEYRESKIIKDVDHLFVLLREASKQK